MNKNPFILYKETNQNYTLQLNGFHWNFPPRESVINIYLLKNRS